VSPVDLLIIGTGPAGMAAAIVARRHGLCVTIVDDQPVPGGQIWRSVEATRRSDEVLGTAYVEGRAVSEKFRACGATYLPGCHVWQVEPGFRTFLTSEGKAQCIESEALILATGAQERPVPFPGWTLPGVMTVGAAQILLKSAGQIPKGPVWIAGSGPLPLLYAIQLLRAGGHLGGFLDTTPAGQWRAALPHLPRALRASGDLIKGLRWTHALHRSGMPFIRNVREVEAVGKGRIEGVSYRDRTGASATIPVEMLLVHEGVVPNIHMPLSMDCDMAWHDSQECFSPIVDSWGESSRPGLFIAGDGAGIAGAAAASLRGELAGLRVASRMGRIGEDSAAKAGRSLRRQLDRALAVRPFLDAMFRPRCDISAPPDRTIVCRCEEVTAGDIRAVAGVGRPGPNQIKTATRAGMGPCQGRQCGYTLTGILSDLQERAPADVGYLHIRPPLRPVTLGELASLHSSTPSDHKGEEL
jgi:NADPH-dependent 2,4-dienoyl-CoA reductase/sulfur reductase-like enzyme